MTNTQLGVIIKVQIKGSDQTPKEILTMTTIQMNTNNLLVQSNNLVVQSLNHAEGDVNWWLVVAILRGSVAIGFLLVWLTNWLINR